MLRKSGFFAVALLLLAPLPAQALGLGEITLNSYLNEPLDADIALISLQPSDLEVFSAEVASVDTFNRYGLDRPDFLSGLRFRVVAGRNGQPILKVSSVSPITEPFVTFLVEANWARGRLLREYTVLLDPPVFNTQAEPPPVSAPQSVTSQAQPQSGFVPRPAPAPEPTPTPAPRRPEAAPQAAATAGSSYGPVRRNQTLWEIADGARQGTGLSVNQMMMAIYRANPEAFLGNINLLKEGSTLRLPGATEAAEISRTEATSVAQQHNQSWRAGGTVAAARTDSAADAAQDDSSGRRLRLVAPGDDESAEPAAAPTVADSGDLDDMRDMLAAEQARNAQLADDVASIRRELEETKRLFNMQSAELADLQRRLADEQGEDTELAVAPLPSDVPPADGGPGDGGVDEPDAPAAAQTPAAEPPDSAAATPPTVADTTPAVSTSAPATATSPGIIARITDFLAGSWMWLLAAAAIIGAAFVALRRDRGDDAESWEALSQEGVEPAAAAAAIPAASEQPIVEEASADEEVEYFEDTGTFKSVDFAEANAQSESATGEFPFEDTLAGEEALKLDQSDPLAEADFHMAYGLYDQAADLVRTASERDPSRRDLKMKLLEIFFVWGNKDAFVESATALHAEMGGGADADWDKVLIMGKQICPDEPLFSGVASGGGAEAVDLQLEDTGQAAVDLNVEAEAGDDDVDLDLGAAVGAAAATAASVDNVIDFDFGSGAADDDEDTAVEKVREQIQAATEDAEDTAEMDLNELGVDLDFGETGSLDEDDFVAIDTDNAPRQDTATEIDVSEDFDELFAGLDDPTATAVPGAAASGQADQDPLPASGDKLLDTSELKVEMEELLAGEGTGEDESTERSMHALPDDNDTVQVGDATAETGSFSAEIKSLAEETFDIDLDIGADDDDATALMEAVPDQTAEAGAVSDDLTDVFGSDDATVLSEAIGDLPDDDADSTAMMKEADDTAMMSASDNTAAMLTPDAAEDDGEGTAMMKKIAEPAAEAEDDVIDFGDVFSGDDPTQQTPAPDESAMGEEAVDFGDVFGDDDSQPTAQVEQFTDEVFAAGQEQTEELSQVDLDVGDSLGDESSGDNTTVRVAAGELALPEADPTRANEVGTKLDLARAYMEMGDPDGARGILQEVIEEGDQGQQEDAKALLKALP